PLPPRPATCPYTPLFRSDPAAEDALKAILQPQRPDAIAVPHEAVPKPTSPVVHFARPTRPVGAGIDLGSRFASAGAGSGGLGLGDRKSTRLNSSHLVISY